ncbi:MAG: hypothetical protein EA400_15750 [Chromatiaceae bacterium]|nr:MAG: hypothetical protein EA400_15750 [Chromatiaceae bacterium]
MVVLGMHRSGTSAIAAALRVMGVDLGRNLMPPRTGINDRGFFEDMDIYRFNEDLLTRLETSWHSLDPALGERLREVSLTSLRRRAEVLLRSKLTDTSLFGMKDPRLPRVLPFWQAVFEELGFEAAYVIALRNPLSVAASLKQHHGFATGKGLLLWLQHSLAAVSDSRGARRVVLQYERLLAAPETELERVARALGLADRVDRAALADFSRDFLDASLCHAHFTAEELRRNPEVPGLVADAFEWLSRIAADELDLEGPEATRALQGLEAELEALRPLLNLIVATERSAAEAASRLAACQPEQAVSTSPALRKSPQHQAAKARLSRQWQNQKARRGGPRASLGGRRPEACDLSDAAEEIATAARRIEATQAIQGQANAVAAQRLDECRQESACLSQALQACEAEQQALREQLGEMTEQVHDLAGAAAERDAIVASTIWRMTAPLRRLIGAARGEAGLPRLPARIASAAAELSPDALAGAAGSAPKTEIPEATVAEVVANEIPNLIAIATYPDPSPRNGGRITLLTDTLGATSLFGGVATAIILAVLLAQHLGLRLRIATRHSPPEPANLGTVLQAHGIAYHANIEFEYAPTEVDSRALAIQTDELILTTSWWTTWAARRSLDPSRIWYLVQEDERMFYPAGDLQLRCQEIFCDERLNFIVNTTALRDHLIAAGMRGITSASPAFEPAFPSTIYYPERAKADRCRTFFFYARPHHPRNLFLRGLEAIAAAVETGLFPPAAWEFHFLGRGLPPVKLPHAIRPQLAETLSWKEYAALIRRVDVGLSLQYTPHPSYPPFDLAASGAVVVTNQQPARPPLSRYCDNILCAEPALDDLVRTLGEAATLAQDESRRQENHRSAGIARDWEAAMAPVLTTLAKV